MKDTEIKELKQLEKDSAANEVWLSKNKISKTDKIEKEKNRRLKMAMEFGEILRPLRIQYEKHREKAVRDILLKEERAAALDGLPELKAFLSTLTGFKTVKLASLGATVDEVAGVIAKRESILDENKD